MDKRILPSSMGYLVGALVVALFAVLLPRVQTHRDWGFLCETTGSRYGYRQWLGVVKTGSWRQVSLLESRITEALPDGVAYRWVSYRGTGFNVYGHRIRNQHGSPGPMIRLSVAVLNAWVERHTVVEALTLYHVFRDGTEDEVLAQVEAMDDAFHAWHERSLRGSEASVIPEGFGEQDSSNLAVGLVASQFVVAGGEAEEALAVRWARDWLRREHGENTHAHFRATRDVDGWQVLIEIQPEVPGGHLVLVFSAEGKILRMQRGR